jgi:hypothetical protein
MSTYEKIASAAIAVLVVAMVLFSFHEITEPKGSDHEREPNFQQSLGPDLKMGAFTTLLDQRSSGPQESNCKQLQPVILGTLHDVDVRLEQLSVYKPGVFEVNQRTLDLLCYQNASLILSNDQGAKLLLEKLPFKREVPSGGSSDDIGTDVRINATVILPGAVPPSTPTTYGEELVPDRYLDAVSQE